MKQRGGFSAWYSCRFPSASFFYDRVIFLFMNRMHTSTCARGVWKKAWNARAYVDVRIIYGTAAAEPDSLSSWHGWIVAENLQAILDDGGNRWCTVTIEERKSNPSFYRNSPSRKVSHIEVFTSYKKRVHGRTWVITPGL